MLRVSNEISGVSLLVEVFAPISLGFQRRALTAPYANPLQIRRSTIHALIGGRGGVPARDGEGHCGRKQKGEIGTSAAGGSEIAGTGGAGGLVPEAVRGGMEPWSPGREMHTVHVWTPSHRGSRSARHSGEGGAPP